ncbi:TIGR04282 family arsenosugar biosynthesis glycosyltransferase [Poritiphilus sp. M415]|uniref:TIGR04282 family arsenosugar biosynthesis glycosyltransferase n=1 Tax=Lentiprolixibacter aurantiacus TaxID=2993939 RepID=A0AAE3MHZ2_9FLAO|nr:TIGR04282 family arsenosugar biosynthesis glycosyltransferase [Lentiprolixibacter aurantiacus]MCX2718135.1 TIGR04282 family arsenosugar biosynthesis glycosyltransferase [Lentiprolixibacter aurantiacus]
MPKKCIRLNTRKLEKDNLLLIFTRNPELGKCKTRLASVIGNESALEIYKFLLARTSEITKGLEADKAVFYSDNVVVDDLWDNQHYNKREQRGQDLGERMLNAFQWGFEQGYQKILIIGSDLYDLSSEDLKTAFKALEKNEFVIGPASDGGYYLLGMKQLKKELFQDKSWGKASVLEDTLKDLKGQSLQLLEIRNDVDLYEDIKDIDVFQKFLKKTYDQ